MKATFRTLVVLTAKCFDGEVVMSGKLYFTDQPVVGDAIVVGGWECVVKRRTLYGGRTYEEARIAIEVELITVPCAVIDRYWGCPRPQTVVEMLVELEPFGFRERLIFSRWGPSGWVCADDIDDEALWPLTNAKVAT